MGHRKEPDARVITKNYLRAWREHLGLAQTAVQQRLGWPPSRLYTIEAGRAVLTGRVLTALAEVYGCTVDDLLHRPPPAEKRPDEPGTALEQALALLAGVGRDAQQMRADLAGRMDVLERDLNAAAEKIDAAMRESEELRAALQRAADILAPVRLRHVAVIPDGDSSNSSTNGLEE